MSATGGDIQQTPFRMRRSQFEQARQIGAQSMDCAADVFLWILAELSLHKVFVIVVSHAFTVPFSAPFECTGRAEMLQYAD